MMSCSAAPVELKGVSKIRNIKNLCNVFLLTIEGRILCQNEGLGGFEAMYFSSICSKRSLCNKNSKYGSQEQCLAILHGRI